MGRKKPCNGIVSWGAALHVLPTLHPAAYNKQLVCPLVLLLAPITGRINGRHPPLYRRCKENIIWSLNYLSEHQIIPLLNGSRETNIMKQHSEPNSMLPWRCTSAWIGDEEVKETSLEQDKEPSLPRRYCLSCLARSRATPGDEFGGLIEGAQK